MTLLDLSIVNVALPSLRSGSAPTTATSAVDRGRVRAGVRRACWCRPAGSAMPAAGVPSSSSASRCSPPRAPPPVPPRTRPLLAVARVVQGIGGGLISPQVSGFIQNLFRGPERARAFGLFGATLGIATAIGRSSVACSSSLGGPDLGWRLVFYVNVPIGAVLIVLALRLLPRSAAERTAAVTRPGRGGAVRGACCCCPAAVGGGPAESGCRSAVVVARPGHRAAHRLLLLGAVLGLSRPRDPGRSRPAEGALVRVRPDPGHLLLRRASPRSSWS